MSHSVLSFLSDVVEQAMASQTLQSTEDPICTTKDYLVFRVMEFGVKSVPSILFFIFGTMRYLKIRDIGQGRVVYSLHFKFKVSISAAMGIAYLIYMFVCWAQPWTASHSSWINRCNDDYFVLFYGIQGLAWLCSCFLMVFEYNRRLSEEWYANQLYWCLNFIFEVITFLVLVTGAFAQDPTMMILSIFNMCGNLMLIVLMAKTERRTLENRRPEANDQINMLLHSGEAPRRRSASTDGPFINVKFYDKVI